MCNFFIFLIVFQEDKKVPLGVKLDVTFSLLRIGLFYNNRKVLGCYLSLTETIRSVRTLSWRHKSYVLIISDFLCPRLTVLVIIAVKM